MRTAEAIKQIAIAMGKCIGETDVDKLMQDPKNKEQIDEFAKHLTPVIESIKISAAKRALETAAELIRPINDPHKRWTDSNNLLTIRDNLTIEQLEKK